MKYVSIDLETTGLDPKQDQILSVGMVVEDTENILPIVDLPKIEIRVLSDRISGSIFALDMNRDLIEAINDQKYEGDHVFYCKEDEVVQIMYGFIHRNFGHHDAKVTVAGKNFNGFDIKFLETLTSWGYGFKFHRRVIDPAVLSVDWSQDTVLPDLSLCKKRSRLPELVTHNAVDDALDVIMVMRERTKNYTV